MLESSPSYLTAGHWEEFFHIAETLGFYWLWKEGTVKGFLIKCQSTRGPGWQSILSPGAVMDFHSLTPSAVGWMALPSSLLTWQVGVWGRVGCGEVSSWDSEWNHIFQFSFWGNSDGWDGWRAIEGEEAAASPHPLLLNISNGADFLSCLCVPQRFRLCVLRKKASGFLH